MYVGESWPPAPLQPARCLIPMALCGCVNSNLSDYLQCLGRPIANRLSNNCQDQCSTNTATHRSCCFPAVLPLEDSRLRGSPHCRLGVATLAMLVLGPVRTFPSYKSSCRHPSMCRICMPTAGEGLAFCSQSRPTGWWFFALFSCSCFFPYLFLSVLSCWSGTALIATTSPSRPSPDLHVGPFAIHCPSTRPSPCRACCAARLLYAPPEEVPEASWTCSYKLRHGGSPVLRACRPEATAACRVAEGGIYTRDLPLILSLLPPALCVNLLLSSSPSTVCFRKQLPPPLLLGLGPRVWSNPSFNSPKFIFSQVVVSRLGLFSK
jgi:hypothetical protein